MLFPKNLTYFCPVNPKNGFYNDKHRLIRCAGLRERHAGATAESTYGIEHVSTGEVIRDEIRRGTELGRSMESYIKAGKLAPDQIVIGMIANYVAEHKHAKGCIFDGFPRTTVQAEEFDKILAGHGLQVDIMIDIHVPEEELIQRILLRGKDSGRADDASEEVIRGRLDVYRQQTAVVSDYYAAQGKYASVNGTGTMDDVFARITDVIAQL